MGPSEIVIAAITIAFFAAIFMPLIMGAMGEDGDNMPKSGFLGFLMVGGIAFFVATGAAEGGFIFIGVIVFAVLMLVSQRND